MKGGRHVERTAATQRRRGERNSYFPKERKGASALRRQQGAFDLSGPKKGGQTETILPVTALVEEIKGREKVNFKRKGPEGALSSEASPTGGKKSKGKIPLAL